MAQNAEGQTSLKNLSVTQHHQQNKEATVSESGKDSSTAPERHGGED